MRLAWLPLAVLALACAGCHRISSKSSSFPAPGSAPIKSGDFITSTGAYESIGLPGLPDQIIDLRLSISPSGKTIEMKFDYELRPSAGGRAVNGWGNRPGPAMNFTPGWFCFVEKPGSYWTFNGRNSLRVDTQAPLVGPSKTIIHGIFVSRDNPKVPDAVLVRLPAKQRELLSPSPEERPSF